MEQPGDKAHFFSGLKTLLMDYLGNRLESARLVVSEKTAKVIAWLVSGIIILVVFLYGLLFLSIVAGFYFGHLLHNMVYGFGIVAFFYLVIFIVLLACRKQLIEKYIVNAVIRILFNEEDGEKEHH